jgi:hypothetical protein
MREGRDGAEGVLRPPDEEILSPVLRALALVTALAVVTGGCASVEPTPVVVGPIVPPSPARNTAAVADPADERRFACAVEVQRAQQLDPGRSLHDGALLGAVLVGAAGAGLGAVLGLIGDIPGKAAAVGAIVGGGAGAAAGGLLKLDGDSAAYERGVAACMSVPRPAPMAVPAGLVEYRLRTVSLRQEAFSSFLGAAELDDGAAGPGLVRLAAAADSGALERGIVLYDRRLAPAFATEPTDLRVKRGGAGRDYWEEARWYGRPGERTVWILTARNRRPQEVRRLALSDVRGLAQFRPSRPPLFGASPSAAVAFPLGLVQHAETRGAGMAVVTGALDPSRGVAALVARNDDLAYPDRVYLVVTHAATAATYEAVVAWGERAVERVTVDARGD